MGQFSWYISKRNCAIQTQSMEVLYLTEYYWKKIPLVLVGRLTLVGFKCW